MGEALITRRGGGSTGADIVVQTITGTFSAPAQGGLQQFIVVQIPEGYGVAGIAEIRLIGDKSFVLYNSSYHNINFSFDDMNYRWELFVNLACNGYSGTMNLTVEADLILAKTSGTVLQKLDRRSTRLVYYLPNNVTNPANTPIKFS